VRQQENLPSKRDRRAPKTAWGRARLWLYKHRAMSISVALHLIFFALLFFRLFGNGSGGGIGGGDGSGTGKGLGVAFDFSGAAGGGETQAGRTQPAEEAREEVLAEIAKLAAPTPPTPQPQSETSAAALIDMLTAQAESLKAVQQEIADQAREQIQRNVAAQAQAMAQAATSGHEGRGNYNGGGDGRGKATGDENGTGAGTGQSGNGDASGGGGGGGWIPKGSITLYYDINISPLIRASACKRALKEMQEGLDPQRVTPQVWAIGWGAGSLDQDGVRIVRPPQEKIRAIVMAKEHRAVVVQRIPNLLEVDQLADNALEVHKKDGLIYISFKDFLNLFRNP